MKSLLPISATDQERAIEQAIRRSSNIESPHRRLWNPDTCPVELLPWLAWTLSIDDWDPDWNEIKKRSVIASAIDTHKHKGTRGAVTSAVNALGATIAVREWWEDPVPDPEDRKEHTFVAYICTSCVDGPVSQKLQNDLVQAIDRTKPVRSHYEVVLGTQSGRKLPIYGAGRVIHYKRLTGFLQRAEDEH